MSNMLDKIVNKVYKALAVKGLFYDEPVRFESTNGPIFWYMHSCLLMHNNRLFSMHSGGEEIHWTVFQNAIEQTPMPIATVNLIKNNGCFPDDYMITIDFPMDALFTQILLFPNHYTIYDREFEHGVFYDRLTPKAKKIQSVIGRKSRAILHERRLALAMCTHHRLGAESLISMIGSDMLKLAVSTAASS